MVTIFFCLLVSGGEQAYATLAESGEGSEGGDMLQEFFAASKGRWIDRLHPVINYLILLIFKKIRILLTIFLPKLKCH